MLRLEGGLPWEALGTILLAVTWNTCPVLFWFCHKNTVAGCIFHYNVHTLFYALWFCHSPTKTWSHFPPDSGQPYDSLVTNRSSRRDNAWLLRLGQKRPYTWQCFYVSATFSICPTISFPCCVQLKLTEHCKATILKLNKKLKKGKTTQLSLSSLGMISQASHHTENVINLRPPWRHSDWPTWEGQPSSNPTCQACEQSSSTSWV